MKTRNDFVSNSSSCSYVLSTSKTPKQIAEKFSDLRSNIDVYREYMESNIAMTLQEIWWIPKKKNPQGEYWNGIAKHCCIPRNEMSKYFDENGNVRKDLDIHNICRGKFSYEPWRESDDTDRCGQVTKETIAFCRWLYDEITTKKDASIWAEAGEYKYFIDRIEKEIKKKKLYVMYFCFSGLTGSSNMIDLGTSAQRWPRIQKAGFDYCYDYHE